ncbi:hypothetical protein BT93_L2956 [Corymbia citriodora subsp. variegata]|uniref:Uncharacterized protein n=1 Tax=Corymbia citriodora subsp. variegata TaxID=360336 RepID=A0A8T0CI62_CORYI|nr:hypothetical protein BT93_L2956 [Corymbia citriodora subsp. variegata]
MRPAASSAAASAHRKSSPLRHFLAAPLRALSRARDLYVRSILSCASAVGQGHVTCPGGQHAPLPRSFSVASSRLDGGGDPDGYDDDFRELVRAASARTLGYNAEDLDAVLRQIRKNRPGPGPRVLPKSCSVGMGRIEEERECDVGGEKEKEKEKESVRRSRSYAVVDSQYAAGF